MLPKDLIKAYKERRLILFVGSGVSRNLALPSWGDLIFTLGEELGYDGDIYKTFGDYLALAEYYCIKKDIAALCERLDNEWHAPRIDITQSKIHNLLVEGDFPIIYTTNYDRWIEKAFEAKNIRIDVVKNIYDISSMSSSERKVIKFHGDFSEPSSIVLGETSYYKRLSFESPLDIKFRSDILDKKLLFIGYSLSDINIRFLFYKFSQIWKDTNIKKRFSAYIFSNDNNPIQAEIFKQWKIKMISPEKPNTEQALYTFLKKLINTKQ